MKYHLYLIVAFFAIFFSGASKKIIDLPASQLHPYGRYQWTPDKHVELISSAAHVGFEFEGNECSVFAYINDNNGHNYLQYEMDGNYIGRVRIDGNNKKPMVIKSSGKGKHQVWLYKATEAHTGPVFIEKISGNGIQSLKRPNAPLIEFIGNSITCGADADTSELACGVGVYHDYHNAYYAYGPRVARALHTNFMLSSVSGIGIYRNWNSDAPTMPQVYENTDLQVGSKYRWNFKTYSPRVVSIALGTNDYSSGDGKHPRAPFDSATFVSGYIKFIQLVKSKYPTAQIALLSSPMVGGHHGRILQNCLTAVKQSVDAIFPDNKPIALYFFKPMTPRGCSWHPSLEDHAILAEELIPFFKGLME